MFKRFIKIMIGILILPIAYIGIVLLVAQITYYQPNQVEDYTTKQPVTALKDSVFSVLMWNIGYAGLGADSDFFYDGGTQTRPSKKEFQTYWTGIQTTLKDVDADFILLQEVDEKSKRSYQTNQVKALSGLRKSSVFATNYKVQYVPMPVFNPMGKVNGGLLSLSNFNATSSKRIQFPGSYEWPTKLFFLRRCMLVQRFQLTNSEQELVVINAHFSAYDDGNLKEQELKAVKKFVKAEELNGNYVLIGADWNQEPTNEAITNFLPNWQVVFDESTPTNRSLDAPYNEDTATKFLDYFLVSPNLKVEEIKTINQEFAYSDHQPIYLKVKLINPLRS